MPDGATTTDSDSRCRDFKNYLSVCMYAVICMCAYAHASLIATVYVAAAGMTPLADNNFQITASLAAYVLYEKFYNPASFWVSYLRLPPSSFPGTDVLVMPQHAPLPLAPLPLACYLHEAHDAAASGYMAVASHSPPSNAVNQSCPVVFNCGS